MRRTHFLFTCLAAALVCGQATAQEFKPYPTSRLDQKLSSAASSGNAQCQVFTADDAFDRIYAYYKGLYKEYQFRVPKPVLPAGKQLDWAYFILDDAKDLSHSRYWLKIQHPFILDIDKETLEPKDIRDVSVIQTVRRK